MNLISRRITQVTYLVALLPLASWAEIYVYPAKVERNIDCVLAADTLESIARPYSHDQTSQGVAKATAVDLNDDGQCEVFLDFPAVDAGNGTEMTGILFLKQDDYHYTVALPRPFRYWWYGESRNGYLRILVGDYTGHRTNPTYVTDVYYYDGEKYVREFDSDFSHGYYKDLGLEAYQQQDYVAAEKYYLNAFRMWREYELDDANNLALTWIKLGQLEKAEQLLLQQIAARPERKQQRYRDNRDVAAAYFNIGLISEIRGNLPAALNYFQWSNGASPNNARHQKIQEIQKRLGVTDYPFKCINENGEVSFTDNAAACSNPEEVPIQPSSTNVPIDATPATGQFSEIAAEVKPAGARRRGRVVIDGVMERGEWRGVEPLVFELGKRRRNKLDVSVYVMNDRESLYIAVTYRLPRNVAGNQSLFIAVDQEFLGKHYEGQDTLGLYTRPNGNHVYRDHVRTRKEPCTSSGLCAYEDTTAGGTVDGEGAYGLFRNTATYEFKKPLMSKDHDHDMDVEIGDTIGLHGHLTIRFEGGRSESYNIPGPKYFDVFPINVVDR